MKSGIQAWVVCGLFLSVIGCSGSDPNQRALREYFGSSAPSAPITPSVTAPALDPRDIAPGGSRVVELSNGTLLVVQKVASQLVFQVEGTFTDEVFARLKASTARKTPAERRELMRKEVQKAFQRLRKANAIPLAEYEEVGYFTFLLPYREDLFGGVNRILFEDRLILNPVLQTPGKIEALKASDSPRDSKAGFSGLERIGVFEFIKQAESDIGGGVLVNGSSVKIGIADTGITYNHPTFASRLPGADPHARRIVYMKEFSGEGTVYFNSKAKFVATVGATADELLIDAETITTPTLPSMPVGDEYAKVEKFRIKVSPELRAKLLDPQSGAKLGVFREELFASGSEEVDLNGNQLTDDHMPMIYLPGKTPEEDVVYFDPSAQNDFTKIRPLRDWNLSHDMMEIRSERVGFSFQNTSIPSKDPSQAVDVRAVSIVGFDPGNHGSHVAGISAGSKTISNDADDTHAHGVAPEASIMMNRVCANNGGCNATAAFIDLATVAGADVINMSIGGLSPYNDGYSVQETMINRLSQTYSVLFSVAAGNAGPGLQTINSPSTARLALSVCATASKELIQRQYQWPANGSDDFVLFFSSRGPSAAGGFKPNLCAPGTELSSIQLNAAPGEKSGLDVLWGTSMAAPTLTGAYALLLDAVRKYNFKNPTQGLSTDPLVLRRVLIATARPFSTDRYTWIDEGTGMVDLPSAWKKLAELRDLSLPSAVSLEGKPIELDYEVLVSTTGPNGIPYDGSRQSGEGFPVFGAGLFIDYSGQETLRQVSIARRLPIKYMDHAQIGDLTRQLVSSADEFVLKTEIDGSDKVWVRAGVRDQLDCQISDTANLNLIGRSAEIQVDGDGTGKLAGPAASLLNICLNRKMIAHELSPGDHGALIYGYRTVAGRVDAVPSFIVPIYLTVPHKTMSASTAYEIQKAVPSFGVDRNYVKVPKGTSVVRVTLEVPAMKLGDEGLPVDYADCAGVELMSYEGVNNANTFSDRASGRAFNCTGSGIPAPESKRKLSFSRTNPTAGLWDLHVFGSYKYEMSKYSLRVDYVTATSSVKKIEGKLKDLDGSLTWNLKESSLDIFPDGAFSTYELVGLKSTTSAKVADKSFVIVASPLGRMRAYPEGTETVTITTGQSKGNDLDMTLFECKPEAKSFDEEGCTKFLTSGGPTDEEKIMFRPRTDRVYTVRVDGFDIKSDGQFVSTETIQMGTEKGKVVISGQSSSFTVGYGFNVDTLLTGKLVTHPLFISGAYTVIGSLVIRSADATVLDSIPVEISK